MAYLSLHFNRLHHEVTIEEINAYLYRKSVHEGLSESYFKQTVFGMRFWFRLFDLEAEALKLPMIKKDKKLPVVLSKVMTFKANASPPLRLLTHETKNRYKSCFFLAIETDR